ncbi:MAG: branched-chain amino acid transport system II carrier protein [Clostridia bacterium]|nr:branched-chain amino acid transport system II carrier protein [Clostridia bacterium]
MKLEKKNLFVVSVMLFALFFGAGNLIFPPFLGQNAGSNTLFAMLGFIATAVILPVLGVVVVARFDGLEKLGRQVGKRFALVFTVLIYLSIGPGLGIPRAASVPFEMAVAPYLPDGANAKLWMAAYSLVFFLVAMWLCLNPGKLVDRIGRVLTPTLLALITLLFVCFLFRGKVQVSSPQEAYGESPFLKGFTEGYNTMDTIAALNFGLVISTTLGSFGLREKRDKMRYTVIAGTLAGTILALVYAMLSYMGRCSSGVYEIQENGAWTLRCIVYQVFGAPGAVLLAAIFTLACLTTCVGLINSISQYFSTLFKKVSYKAWVYIITFFSFLICNLGLSMILSISIPVLNAIYPVSIVLILLGLTHDLWKNNRFVYPMTVAGTAVVSVVYSLKETGAPLGAFGNLFQKLPLYKMGFGWVCVAGAMLLLSIAVNLTVRLVKKEKPQKAAEKV